VDVHYKFSKVSFRDAHGELVAVERLDHPDRQKLRERLARWPQGLPVVLEASFGWGWLADMMLELGLHPQLSNCYKVEQMRRARGWAKTNKKDAELLSLLPFEASEWWRVWLAPPAVRDCREWMRYRADLVMMQTRVKNRIHAIFHRHGIFHEFSDLFGGRGRRFLHRLCFGGGGELTGGALVALAGQVRLLNQLRQQLAEVAWVLRRQLRRTERIRQLKTIPGFGLILSHVVRAEVGQLDRFASHRALASYSLLAPMARDSGEEDGQGVPLGRHVGHRGNRTLKWAFIEAAHGAVRTGGRWRAMFDRYTAGGKKNRNRGYIKVARELVKMVYVVWKQDRPYFPSPPPRPGHRVGRGRRGKRSRSGTG
jgi:transposase